MTAAYAVAAGLYLFLGHVWWRRTFVTIRRASGARHAEAAEEALRAWQHEASAAEARATWRC